MLKIVKKTLKIGDFQRFFNLFFNIFFSTFFAFLLSPGNKQNQLKACRGQIDQSEDEIGVSFSLRLSKCIFIRNLRLIDL